MPISPTEPAPSAPRDWVRPLCWTVLACLATAAVVAMGFAAIQRVPYPYELEWMEGSMVDHTARVVDGRPIYTEPSWEHVPYLYTPLYFYASALLAQLGLGLDFLALRLVNLGSTVLACALLAWLLRRELGRWMPALVGAAIPIAGYGYVDSWYDLSRNDGLFFLLVFATVAVLRHGKARWIPIAGALAAGAFLAKQSAVFILPALCLGTLTLGAARAVWFGACACVALGLTVLVFHLTTDGWFTFFVFEMPSGHGINGQFALFWNHWSEGILPLWPAAVLAIGLVPGVLRGDGSRPKTWGYLAIAVLLFGGTAWLPLAQGPQGVENLALASCILWPAVLVPLVWTSTPPRWLSPTPPTFAQARGFWLVLSAGMFALAWLSRRHAGGHLNAFIPALIAAGVLAAYALDAAARRPRPLLFAVVTGLIATMLFHLRYDPRRLVPSAANAQANEALAEWVRGIDGDTLLLYHGHLAAREGKARTAHAMAIADVFQYRGGDNRGWRSFTESLAAAGKDQQFAAVVIDGQFVEVARAIVAPLVTGMRQIPSPVAQPKHMQPVVGMRNAFPKIFLQR